MPKWKKDSLPVTSSQNVVNFILKLALPHVRLSFIGVDHENFPLLPISMNDSRTALSSFALLLLSTTWKGGRKKGKGEGRVEGGLLFYSGVCLPQSPPSCSASTTVVQCYTEARGGPKNFDLGFFLVFFRNISNAHFKVMFFLGNKCSDSGY